MKINLSVLSDWDGSRPHIASGAQSATDHNPAMLITQAMNLNA